MGLVASTSLAQSAYRLEQQPEELPDDYGHAHEGSGGKGFAASSRAETPSQDFDVAVQKRPGDVLGAGLGNTSKGAVIMSIQQGGLLASWNQANPEESRLRPGHIITECNGIAGYWAILEQIKKPGMLDMKVSSTPPSSAGRTWFEDIARMGRDLETSSASSKGSFMLKLQPQDPSTKNHTFSSLTTARAGDCGVDQCAICIDDLSPEDPVVQLPCKHAFHAQCAARWLMQANCSNGKCQCCPVCRRKIVSTADGGIAAEDSSPNDSCM